MRVQAGQPDLIETVDHVADRVLVGLHQLGDQRDPVPAGRGKQHHRPPEPHRAGAAPPRRGYIFHVTVASIRLWLRP
jgi:hypothetical protein